MPNQDWSCLCLVGKSFRIILTQPRWGCFVWRQFHLSPSSGGQLFCSQTPAPISLCKSREFSICNWKDFCHLGLLCRPVKTWEKLSFGVESWTGAPKRQIWEAILQDIFNLLLNAKNCIFKNVAVFYAFRNAFFFAFRDNLKTLKILHTDFKDLSYWFFTKRMIISANWYYLR